MGNSRSHKRITIKGIFLVIIGGYFVVAVTFITATWLMLNDVIEDAETEEKLINLTSATQQARYHIIQVQQFLTDVSATGNRDGFNEAREHYEQAVTNLKTVASLSPQDAAGVEAIIKRITSLHEIGISMAEAYLGEGREAGNAIMQRPDTGLDAVSLLLAKELESFAKQLDQKLTNKTHDIRAEMGEAKTIILGFSIGSVLCAVVVLFLISQKVLPPLENLKKSLQDMNTGTGDLTRRLPVSGNDEISDVVVEFNNLLSVLHNLMTMIAGTITKLGDAARDMDSVAADTSAGINRQRSETDQIATAITEMSATVQEVAKNTAQAAEAANEADEKTNQGMSLITRVKESNSRLNREMSQSSQVINELGENSTQIGAVVQVIRDIAEQTNLLALNAAIEAARAGEQGRGFAVVADEVRNLANRTQESTQEIQQFIEQLQDASKRAVGTIETGCQNAAESETISQEAHAALQVIAEMVSRMRDMNHQIATAAEEQSSVAEEVDRNINRIVEVTNQTVTGAEHNHQNAKQLLSLSTNLTQLLTGFKI